MEELGLADGMFFAPLTIEGPKEANQKAADTWAFAWDGKLFHCKQPGDLRF